MTKKQKGGKVIASGGFGCIFKPALKCENDDSEYRDTNKITKLMAVKYATDEYKTIKKFSNILQAIPNYNKYFLFSDVTLCKPKKLTHEDFNNYNKCQSFKKQDINAKNINNSLDKLLALNMPDGGMDVIQFVWQYFIPLNIVNLNNSLIDLLVHGIVPMNKLNVYHCDIKDGNILVKITEMGLETRLIDWGLSFIHHNKQGIPRKIYRRPFQYNVPFSSVLFNEDFSDNYNTFLENYSEPDYFQIREFVVNYIFIWNEKRGPGHLSAINDIIKKLFISELKAINDTKIKEHMIEYDFTYYYIIEYLSKILEKYTQKGKLDLMTYFNTVFLKNIDIWGFIMTYITLYEYLYDSFKTLTEYQLQFINQIKYIIVHFLYENPINPIDISLLTLELTKLNPIVEKIVMKQNVGGNTKRIKHLYNGSNKTRKQSNKKKQKR